MTYKIRYPALAWFLVCMAGGPAFAHAHLRSATPPLDGTATGAPTELDLIFSEGVNLKFSGATIATQDGRAVATGDVRHGVGGDTTLVVPLATPLTPGRYKVDWHALANDGHKTSGSYTVTITP